MKQAEFIAQQIERRRKGRILCPVVEPRTFKALRITTPYGIEGDAWGAGHHTGEDHACPEGSYAVAVSWGHVIGTGPNALGWGQAYGDMVIIQMAKKDYVYAYCHLSHVRVEVGDSVKPGQVVALTGYTGHVLPPGPAGAHLHFEARPVGGRYGSDVNPIKVKRGRT